MILTLPYPPTVNTYWRHARGRHYISAKGLAYRKEVWKLVRVLGEKPLEGRLWVSIALRMPDHRIRDLDNVLKALLDALEHARAYLSDNQIDELRIRRVGVEKPGSAFVTIVEIDETLD